MGDAVLGDDEELPQHPATSSMIITIATADAMAKFLFMILLNSIS